MKQFNLNEYIENPSRKVVTRDGRPVRIICTDAFGEYPIVALVKHENREVADYFNKDGKWINSAEDGLDLFFELIKKEGWVNLYRTERGFIIFGSVFDTKEDALDELERTDSACKHIDTIQIEWEEEQS